MKLLKTVGGYHYVEGGPECKNVYWIYNPDNKCPACGEHLEVPYIGHDDKCSVCHGTGYLAVERWSDAQKAAKLCEWGYDGFDYYHTHDPKDEDNLVMAARVTSLETGKPVHTFGYGKDLTEALTALVIAVAEVEP